MLPGYKDTYAKTKEKSYEAAICDTVKTFPGIGTMIEKLKASKEKKNSEMNNSNDNKMKFLCDTFKNKKKEMNLTDKVCNDLEKKLKI